MLKNMKVGKSLLLGFGTTIIVSVVIIIVSLFMMNSIRNDYNKLLTTTVSANLDITTARLDANIAARSVRDILLTPDDPANTDMVKGATEAIEEMDNYVASLQQNYPEGQDRTALDKYIASVGEWEAVAVEIVALYERYAATGDQAVLDQAINMVQRECTPALNNMATLGTEVDNGLAEYQNYQVEGIANRSTITLVVLIAVMVVATIVAIAMAIAIVKGITVPVAQASTGMVGFSQGKFDIPVDYTSKNELGQMCDALRTSQNVLKNVVDDEAYLLSEMAAGNFDIHSRCRDMYVGGLAPAFQAIKTINSNLSDTLMQINQSAEQVAAGSEQVSTGAQALAQGATEQASAVEELSATIAEIANNAITNARSSENAAERAQYAGDQATESAHYMEEMVKAMDKISDSSQEIGKIIATIENIAFQTNILALNAAVEAARAGSAGKGFAVVADEVRNLASKSDQAAKATKELIEHSIHSVQDGTEIVKKVSDSLSKTVAATTEVVASINTISKAVEEESESIAQVTEGVDQISSVVQTNSATSEESAAASEELSSQANLMKELMAKFILSTGDDSGHSIPMLPSRNGGAEEHSGSDYAGAASAFSKY